MPPKNSRRKRIVLKPQINAYELLKQAILDGSFQPGQPLIESTLATWLTLSRTPVREALMRLEQDGLAHRNSSGLVVRERSKEEVLDIYDTRCVLEALASEFAAERRTEHDLRSLKHLLDAAKHIDAGDTSKLATHNRAFHLAVWRAGHNEAVLDLLQRLDLHLLPYSDTTLTYPGRWKKALQEHVAIVEAIALRDAKEAGRCTADHTKAAREIRLMSWFQEIPT